MVDILLATYNGEKYLNEQLESLLRQDYKDIRILIRDDGSCDNTMNIIFSYVEKFPKQVVLITEKSFYKCSANNFFILTKYATSDYIMYCDQDDVWFPDKVSTSLKEIKKIEAEVGENIPIIVFGDYVVVDENLREKNDMRGNQISKYKLDINHLLVQNYVTGCLIMANRELYSHIKDYSPAIVMHDWWLSLYCSSFGVLYHFKKKLMLYRQHRNNFVGAVDVKSFKYVISKLISSKTKDMKWVYKIQAEEFLKEYEAELPENKKVIYKNFIDIYAEKSKIKRIYKLCKGRYLKSDIIRILGQFFYI